MAVMYRDEAPLPLDAHYRVMRTRSRPHTLLPSHDAAWDAAQRITWGPERYRTGFRALWNQMGLAIRFDVCDHRPWHTMTRPKAPIWEEEVVEIFLDPGRAGRHYVELEINPINVVTDLLVTSPWPNLTSELDWRWRGLESTVVPGSCGGMSPDSWVALAWLPWEGLDAMAPHGEPLQMPEVGERWHFNVFRIKRPHGPAEPEREAIYAAWSTPDGPSFHAPERFRELVFD
jgi:hypothetical protein